MSSTDPDFELLRRQLLARVDECLQLLREAGSLPRRAPAPTILFDLKGLAAGQASSAGVLRFNPRYLQHDPEHFLQHTVAHEVAHYADFLRRGRSDHGPRWQLLMRQLGVAPSRTHPYQLPLSAVSRLRTFVYHCDCRQLELTSIRHNRQQRALAGRQGPLYYCPSCRQPLRYQPVPG